MAVCPGAIAGTPADMYSINGRHWPSPSEEFTTKSVARTRLRYCSSSRKACTASIRAAQRGRRRNASNTSAIASSRSWCTSFISRVQSARSPKGKNAWKPKPRTRKVSQALRAYALMTTSADKGAIRDISKLEEI